MMLLQGSGQLFHDYNFSDAEDSVSEWQSFVAVFKDKRRFSQWNQSWCPSPHFKETIAQQLPLLEGISESARILTVTC
jgi:hypothetical protein